MSNIILTNTREQFLRQKTLYLFQKKCSTLNKKFKKKNAAFDDRNDDVFRSEADVFLKRKVADKLFVSNKNISTVYCGMVSFIAVVI